MRAETRSAVIAGLVCAIVAAVVIGVIRGGDAEPGVRGARMVFAMDLDAVEPGVDRDQAVRQAVDVVRERIDERGIERPTVVARGEEIVVELVEPTDEVVAGALSIIERTAKLAFVEEDTSANQYAWFTMDRADPRAAGITVNADVWNTDAGERRQGLYLMAVDRAMLEKWLEIIEREFPASSLPADREIAYEHVDNGDRPPYWRTHVLDPAHQVGGRSIADAELTFDPVTQTPSVLVTFDAAGKAAFAELTQRNVGNKIAIVLDGIVKSAPVVNAAITGGQTQVSMGGNDSKVQEREAMDLIAVLRTGSLPAPLVHLSTTPFAGATGGFLARSWLFFAIALALLASLVAWRLTSRNPARAANVR